MMYIFNDNLVVSGRSAMGHMMPQRNMGSQLRILNATSVPDDDTTIVYRFGRPLTGNGVQTTVLSPGLTDMIWAVSDEPVTDENMMAKHSESGTMTIDLFEASPPKVAKKVAPTPPAKAATSSAPVPVVAVSGITGTLAGALAAALLM